MNFKKKKKNNMLSKNNSKATSIVIHNFVGKCCVVNKKYSCRSATLYKKFIKWFPDNPNQEIPSIMWFGCQLSKLFKKSKSNGLIIYRGIDLRNP
jgi:hypothetical protein